MLTTRFLKVVYEFLFASATCSEECIQLCGCCPQSSQVYGAFAGTSGNVISHGLSVPSDRDWACCLEELCELFPKLTDTDFLCLHEKPPYCVHIVTQLIRELGGYAANFAVARRRPALPVVHGELSVLGPVSGFMRKRGVEALGIAERFN